MKMDYVMNARGAKIYIDISKHKFLPIPKVSTTTHKGKTYAVLSAGYHKSGEVMVTIKENGQITAYRLPNGLSGWATSIIGMATQGLNPFPCDVEFGELPNGFYAEII